MDIELKVKGKFYFRKIRLNFFEAHFQHKKLFHSIKSSPKIFSVFSLKVAMRVFKVSSLSSARFSADAAALAKMRDT
jgi:hypothetical protein